MRTAQGLIVSNFLKAHWRARTLHANSLTRFQDIRARTVMAFARAHSDYHRGRLAPYSDGQWREVPPIGKPEMMADFGAYNTANVGLEEAMATALHAETNRDFTPTVRGLTVGLSSGTSGHRGLFLVHPREQAAWAGLMLARVLPGLRLKGYRVALFLRSNSNLYERLGSKWLSFRYFDLMMTLEQAIERLNEYRPDILVGPPSLLGFLADARENGALRHSPLKLISAAEVLEPQDRARLESVFQQQVHQIYQCTEGLMAVSCKCGRLHIQEDLVAMQLEPVPSETDVASPRFVPIVTDLWRATQPIIRYRMNDILTMDVRACPCGSGFRVIDRIEGRSDDILYFHSLAGGLRPFFPDTIRRMALLASDGITDYRAFQCEPGELTLHLATSPNAFDNCALAARQTVQQTLAEYECRPANLSIEHGLAARMPDKKRRRVQRLYEV